MTSSGISVEAKADLQKVRMMFGFLCVLENVCCDEETHKMLIFDGSPPSGSCIPNMA